MCEFDPSAMQLGGPLTPARSSSICSSPSASFNSPKTPVAVVDDRRRLSEEDTSSELDEPLQLDFLKPIVVRKDPPACDFTRGDNVARRQRPRFEGDLYTPLWVRNHGDLKEGWCDLCLEPRWLTLKNSAYWYDRNFQHGISPASGAQYRKPIRCRKIKRGSVAGTAKEDEKALEGLCQFCSRWIPISGRRGSGGTSWFRHANRCHSKDNKEVA